MTRALAAGLLSLALAAHAQAQAPPETPPPTDTPTETQPAAPAPAPSEAPPPPKPAPKTPRASPPAPAPAPVPAATPAPAAQEGPRDAEVAALRGEVSRLQSELDAERAAALTPPDDNAPGAQPARNPWGWLIVTALLALTAGFLLGWRLLDRRIRRKYGGLRIY